MPTVVTSEESENRKGPFSVTKGRRLMTFVGMISVVL